MLQQTQVSRVIEKYHEWLSLFPTTKALTKASLGDVLRAWKGLGYNSRALRLQQLAQVIEGKHRGMFPKTYEELLRLPGIGPYTAGAVYVFALGGDISFVDTNIKRLLHRVFEGHEFFGWKVTDKEITQLAAELYPRGSSYDYHQGLMDLGATICQAKRVECGQCPLREICNTYKEVLANPTILTEKRVPYKKSKTPFKQTKRFLRGRIIDYLREHDRAHLDELLDYIHSCYEDYDKDKALFALEDLVKEGLVNVGGEGEYLL